MALMYLEVFVTAKVKLKTYVSNGLYHAKVAVAARSFLPERHLKTSSLVKEIWAGASPCLFSLSQVSVCTWGCELQNIQRYFYCELFLIDNSG